MARSIILLRDGISALVSCAEKGSTKFRNWRYITDYPKIWEVIKFKYRVL